MKFTILITFIIALSITASAQSKKELEARAKASELLVQKLQAEIEQLKKGKEVDLTTPNKKAGYSMGVLFANNVKGQGGDSLDVEAMVAAVKDVFGKQPLKIDQQQCMPIVQQYMQEASEKKSVVAREIGQQFLENNKKSTGVITTATGLQYKVLTQGTGKTPLSTNNVTVHYVGKLIDGTEFDSSVKKGQPATFGVTQVIAGWTEALQLMKEGDKWMLYIPYQLGYGDRGAGGQIPPFSTLIFEVELIKVN